MSDSYQIGTVTVTPAGGGWYSLSHGSMAEPERLQGKENADARAQALSDALASGTDQATGDEGTMQGQGDLDAALSQTPPEELTANADEVAKLKALLEAARNGQAEELAARLEAEKRAEDAEKKLETKTVVTDGGEVPTPERVPAGVPRRYEGTLDDKAKAELSRLGVNLVRIVLEENESIPPTGLFVGHNGRGYMIQPGVEVDVPDFLLNVLNDAVMSAPVVDAKSQKVLGYRNRSKYPYRRIS